MITNKTIMTIKLFAPLALALFLAFVIGPVLFARASAPSGLQANVASTTLESAPTAVATIFATSSCSARVITTGTNDIRLIFSDYAGQAPSVTFGHLQLASTTVSYDSGIYGCGKVSAFGYGGGTTITATEVR
jgi:hypothetical protein